MMDLLAFLPKLAGLGLVGGAFIFAWTAVQLWRGDALAFRQARESHPTIKDALLGRAVGRPSARPDMPLNDGLVLRKKDGQVQWHLNRRMSDEQYDRLTK
jgi:hypothetical protein